MTHRDFAYWLKGYFEISQADELTKEQVQEIKTHLTATFVPFQDVVPLTSFKPAETILFQFPDGVASC